MDKVSITKIVITVNSIGYLTTYDEAAETFLLG
jgi:hypothetical protein